MNSRKFERQRLLADRFTAVDLPYDRKVALFDAAAVKGIENTLGRLGAAVLNAAWGNGVRSGPGRARLRELAAVPELLRTDGSWHVARLRPEYELGQIRSGRGPLASATVADREQVGYGYAVTALLHTPGGPDPLLFTRNRVVELRTCRGWGDPDRLAALVTQAGYTDIATGSRTVVWEFASSHACTQFLRDVAPPITALVADQSDGVQQRVWRRVTDVAWEPFTEADGRVRLPNQALWVAATAPA